MNKTPLWFDLPSSKSYDFRGVKTVPAKTTGKRKLRYTVLLAAMASGKKLPTMIILEGLKDIPKGRFPNEVILQVSRSGYMSAEMMNIWTQQFWKMRPNVFWRQNSLLVLDRALCHTKRSVLPSFQQHYNTDVAVVPGGMTPLLQPADVSRNKPFKSLIKEKWLEWLNEGQEE